MPDSMYIVYVILSLSITHPSERAPLDPPLPGTGWPRGQRKKKRPDCLPISLPALEALLLTDEQSNALHNGH